MSPLLKQPYCPGLPRTIWFMPAVPASHMVSAHFHAQKGPMWTINNMVTQVLTSCFQNLLAERENTYKTINNYIVR